MSPGPIDTPIFGRSGVPEGEQSALREMIRRNIPMQRFGESEECAAAVLFLASRESSFITGIDLLVDGGTVSFFSERPKHMIGALVSDHDRGRIRVSHRQRRHH